jgi:hypothetical protein
MTTIALNTAKTAENPKTDPPNTRNINVVHFCTGVDREGESLQIYLPYRCDSQYQ